MIVGRKQRTALYILSKLFDNCVCYCCPIECCSASSCENIHELYIIQSAILQSRRTGLRISAQYIQKHSQTGPLQLKYACLSALKEFRNTIQVPLCFRNLLVHFSLIIQLFLYYNLNSNRIQKLPPYANCGVYGQRWVYSYSLRNVSLRPFSRKIIICTNVLEILMSYLIHPQAPESVLLHV